mmetsp:Transcript_84636/g.202862  ORF Transcript_84636/g.202862 Transcript_84636/m.202862 type:complete len:243 (+) Transcript_84636:366-1094(+)
MHILPERSHRGGALRELLPGLHEAGERQRGLHGALVGSQHGAAEAHLQRPFELGLGGGLVTRWLQVSFSGYGQDRAGVVHFLREEHRGSEGPLPAGDLRHLAAAARGGGLPLAGDQLQGHHGADLGHHRGGLPQDSQLPRAARDAGALVRGEGGHGWRDLHCRQGLRHQGVEPKGWLHAERAQGPRALDQHAGAELGLRHPLGALFPRATEVRRPRRKEGGREEALRGSSGAVRGRAVAFWV